MAQDSSVASNSEILDDFLDRVTVPDTVGEPWTALVKPSPELEEAQQASRVAYYLNQSHAWEYRQRVFDWQLWSSKFVFVWIIALLLIAIVFSALQFKAGASQPTVFKLTRDGLEVSSPVLGVIILFASLAFFYLYLVYVYPIHEVN